MTIHAPTLDQVLDLAIRLPPADQARLIARLAPQIEHALETRPVSVASDPWARLDALREEFRALGPSSPSISEQLERDRQERDRALMGRSADSSENDDVHP